MAKEDIILGKGQLYYAPLATANPDETTVAYGGTWTSWTSMGTTLEALTLTISEDRKDIKTQQSLGTLRQFRTSRDISLKTVLAEMTGANLALIHGGTNADTAAGAAQKGFSQVTVGDQPVVTAYKWAFEGVRVGSDGVKQPVRYFFHAGSIGPDGDSAFDKENPTGLPIVITVFEDTSQAAGSEFMVVEIVNAAITA